MLNIKGQKKNNNGSGRSEEETTPANAHASALARLPGLFGEITECLSWGDLDATAKADARGVVLDCLVHSQGSWATAGTLFGLGEALLKHAPELAVGALVTGEEVDDDDVIHAPAARRAAELAALGAECITLSLSLGTPARGHRGRGGGVTLDASLRGRA